MLSLEALIGAGVSLIGGIAGEKIQPKTLMLIALFALTLGMAGLAEARGYALMLVYAVGMGIGFGLTFIASAMLLLAYFGKAPNLRLYSIMSLMSTSAALGPGCRRLDPRHLWRLCRPIPNLRGHGGDHACGHMVHEAPRLPPSIGADRAGRGCLTAAPIAADLLIAGATLITMNAERHVVTDGALAMRGNRIVAVGKRAALEREVNAKQVLDGRRFVMTPGFVDAHIHITGDPITRGFIRGAPGEVFANKLSRWVIPLFRAQTPDDERISAPMRGTVHDAPRHDLLRGGGHGAAPRRGYGRAGRNRYTRACRRMG